MKVLSVSQVNRYVKELICRDMLLSELWVKGEISNFKHHYSGHMYFTLKDEGGTLKCVMFSSQSMKLRFIPNDGMKVIVSGRLGVFEKEGQYQVYVEFIQPDGLGALYAAYEQLKARLEAEGLFAISEKKSLPKYPYRIGVITSPTGAVIRDITNISFRRSSVNLVLFPVAVQGAGASNEISTAIEVFNKLRNVEVIILARGGGSLEDLWAFNEQNVARAIFASDIPIVSAVGHETDFTIADMVADLRAPTPSAAAEIVVPDRKETERQINYIRNRIVASMKSTVRDKRIQIEKIVASKVLQHPLDKVYQARMLLDSLTKRIAREAVTTVSIQRRRLEGAVSRLGSLNPMSILARGYCIALDEKTGKIIAKKSDICKKQQFIIEFIDGKAKVQIISNLQ